MMLVPGPARLTRGRVRGGARWWHRGGRPGRRRRWRAYSGTAAPTGCTRAAWRRKRIGWGRRWVAPPADLSSHASACFVGEFAGSLANFRLPIVVPIVPSLPTASLSGVARHDKPQQDVQGDRQATGKDRGEHPQQADQDGIYVEVLSHAPGDTAQG